MEKTNKKVTPEAEAECPMIGKVSNSQCIYQSAFTAVMVQTTSSMVSSTLDAVICPICGVTGVNLISYHCEFGPEFT